MKVAGESHFQSLGMAPGSMELLMRKDAADATGPKHISLKLIRAKMEQLCEDLFERTMPPCQNCLKDAKLKPDDIAELVMVGGMTRMPPPCTASTEGGAIN